MDAIIAKPLSSGSGYTWTLASRISNAMEEVERRFGPRDPSYFFAGFEFVQSHPKTWYPGSRRHIVIQLNVGYINDFPRMIYQVTHELIHLLAPTGGRTSTYLEEGLAVEFSQSYTLRETGRNIEPGMHSYKKARDGVRQLLESDPGCVLRMRAKEPCISKIGADVILAEVKDCPSDVAAFLATRFDRDLQPTSD